MSKIVAELLFIWSTAAAAEIDGVPFVAGAPVGRTLTRLEFKNRQSQISNALFEEIILERCLVPSSIAMSRTEIFNKEQMRELANELNLTFVDSSSSANKKSASSSNKEKADDKNDWKSNDWSKKDKDGYAPAKNDWSKNKQWKDETPYSKNSDTSKFKNEPWGQTSSERCRFGGLDVRFKPDSEGKPIPVETHLLLRCKNVHENKTCRFGHSRRDREYCSSQEYREAHFDHRLTLIRNLGYDYDELKKNSLERFNKTANLEKKDKDSTAASYS
jgi:hypothetical protein